MSIEGVRSYCLLRVVGDSMSLGVAVNEATLPYPTHIAQLIGHCLVLLSTVAERSASATKHEKSVMITTNTTCLVRAQGDLRTKYLVISLTAFLNKRRRQTPKKRLLCHTAVVDRLTACCASWTAGGAFQHTAKCTFHGGNTAVIKVPGRTIPSSPSNSWGSRTSRTSAPSLDSQEECSANAPCLVSERYTHE